MFVNCLIRGTLHVSLENIFTIHCTVLLLVSVCSGCHNGILWWLKPGWLNQKTFIFFTVLKDGSPRSRCQGWFLGALSSWDTFFLDLHMGFSRCARGEGESSPMSLFLQGQQSYQIKSTSL